MLGLLNPYKFPVVAGDPVPDYISRYTFDDSDTTPTVATDLGPGGHDIALTHAPVSATGIIGEARDFDGTNDYGLVGTHADNTFIETDSFTISVWCYWDSVAQVGLISKYGSDSNRAWGINSQADGSIDGYVYQLDDTQRRAVSPAGAVVADTWYHIAFRYDNTSLELFINGVSVGTQTGSMTSTDTPDVHFGWWNRASSARRLNGRLDDARIYDRALSAAEITALHELRGFELLLHFDGIGAAIVDSSEKGNDPDTVGGNATQSDAQSKFGGKSLLLDGTDDYLEFNSNLDFDFADSDWTVDFWLYDAFALDGKAVWAVGAAHYDAISCFISGAGYPRLFADDDGAYPWVLDALAATSRADAATWNHYAYMRNGSSIYVFKDGGSIGSRTAQEFDLSTFRLRIGRHYSIPTTYDYTGHIDEFAVRKYAAFPTTGFTPPTEAYSP